MREDLTSGDLTKSVELQRAAAAQNETAPSARRLTLPLMIAFGVAVAVLATAVAIYFYGGDSSGSPATSDPFASVNLSRLTTTGTAGVAAISGDGRYAAYVVTENRQQSLWLRQVATTSNVRIVPAGDAEYQDAVAVGDEVGPAADFLKGCFFPRAA